MLKSCRKYCPRCGKEFVCRHDQPSICQCAAVQLTKEVRAYLSAHYQDCLCADCLRELSNSLSVVE
ncbi:MAG: cysteine-rich CWC family protein [Paludibacteraceae bacterium]|nr:cysteine-rich CWC family protein [Paludibacteraceae bacterium]